MTSRSDSRGMQRGFNAVGRALAHRQRVIQAILSILQFIMGPVGKRNCAVLRLETGG